MMRSYNFSRLKVLITALCVFMVPIVSQAVPMQIQQGDSFRYGIDLSGATPAGPYNYMSWFVQTTDSDGFNSGDIMSFALYDDANSGTALGSGTFDWTAGSFTITSLGSMMASNPAFDGTGYLQFTMVAGSIELAGGDVRGINNGKTESGLTDITVLPAAKVSVPEPNTLSLLGLALVFAAFAVKMKGRSPRISSSRLSTAA